MVSSNSNSIPTPSNREWRKAEHYSLEAMRSVLIRLRDVESEWPPIVSWPSTSH